jgi:hypothetical protein
MKLGTAQKIELSSFAQIHFSGSVFIARSRIFAVFVSKRAIRGPSAVFLLKRIDCVEYELGALGIGDIVCIITVKIGKHGMHSITALSVWYGHAVVLSVSSGNVAMLFGVR